MLASTVQAASTAGPMKSAVSPASLLGTALPVLIGHLPGAALLAVQWEVGGACCGSTRR